LVLAVAVIDEAISGKGNRYLRYHRAKLGGCNAAVMVAMKAVLAQGFHHFRVHIAVGFDPKTLVEIHLLAHARIIPALKPGVRGVWRC